MYHLMGLMQKNSSVSSDLFALLLPFLSGSYNLKLAPSINSHNYALPVSNYSETELISYIRSAIMDTVTSSLGLEGCYPSFRGL